MKTIFQAIVMLFFCTQAYAQAVVTTGVAGNSSVSLITTPVGPIRVTTGVVGDAPVSFVTRVDGRPSAIVNIVPGINEKGEIVEVMIVERKTTAPEKRR